MKCPYCKGTGKSNMWINGGCVPCTACKGTGNMEVTNEEWLRTATGEELAEIIYDLLITAKPLSWSNKLHIRVLRDVYEHGNERSTRAIIEWLQEKHE